MPMTVVEKILARASGRDVARAGDVVEPAVDLAMSHENAALVINQFAEIYEGTGLERGSGIRHGSRSSSTTACRRSLPRPPATREGA